MYHRVINTSSLLSIVLATDILNLETEKILFCNERVKEEERRKGQLPLLLVVVSTQLV